MRQTGCVLLLLASLGGCMSTERGAGPGGCPGHYGASRGPSPVPGVQGPYGTPVSMIYPYAASPPSQMAARDMMHQSVPLNMVQIHALNNPGQGSGIVQTSANRPSGAGSGLVQAQHTGPGMPPPPGGTLPPVMPPGAMLSPPGVPFSPGMPHGAPMPGMPGMPPGVPMPGGGPGFQPPPGAVAGVGAIKSPLHGAPFPVSRTQVRFVTPVGMRVFWYTRTPDGKESYSQFPIEVPGRYNFLQAAIYRLKLTNIPGHPGLEVYPTLEVVPANPKTAEFLAHSPVPVAFTDEDFRQIRANNYVVKVIYLPDPQFQDLAFLGPDEIISTQLEPGADPIEEARRRGNILLVIRMGSIDQQAPNTPGIGEPGPGGVPHGPPAGMMPMPHPGAVPPNVMVPFGMPPGGPGMMPPGGPGMPPMPGHGPHIGMPGQPPMPPHMGGVPPSAPFVGMPPQPPGAPFGGLPPTAPMPPDFGSDTIPLPPVPPEMPNPPAGKSGVSG